MSQKHSSGGSIQSSRLGGKGSHLGSNPVPTNLITASASKPTKSALMAKVNEKKAQKSALVKEMNSKNSDRLEVTVIPVDEDPYSKIVQIPHSMIGSSQHSQASQTSTSGGLYGTSGVTTAIGLNAAQSAAAAANQYPSLKDLFQASEILWKPIFGSFVQANKQPLFSIFRKKIERKISVPGTTSTQELGLHILFLKCDGTKFPRNAYANQLEVYCSTYFYGPLVIVFGDTNPPYRLHDFPPEYLLDKIDPLNELEQKYYPLPFSAKKCSLVRTLMNERRFTLDLDQLERLLSLEEFMLYCYKTSFCPMINQKHEWSECNYAHRQQDFRRPPYNFFYYPERCPSLNDDGSWDNCEYYLDCQYAHSLIEILFNPLHYKLKDCPERTAASKFTCPKLKDFCCHAHSQEERDLAMSALKNLPTALPSQHEDMQYYIDLLPDYMEKKKTTDKTKKKADDDNAAKDKKISAAQAETNLQEASKEQWQKLQDMFGGGGSKTAKPATTSSTGSTAGTTTNVNKDTSKEVTTAPTSMIGKPIITKPMTKIISDTDLPASSAFGIAPAQSKTAQKTAITFPQASSGAGSSHVVKHNNQPTPQPLLLFEQQKPQTILEKIEQPSVGPSANDKKNEYLQKFEKKSRKKAAKFKNMKGVQYVVSTGPSNTPQPAPASAEPEGAPQQLKNENNHNSSKVVQQTPSVQQTSSSQPTDPLGSASKATSGAVALSTSSQQSKAQKQQPRSPSAASSSAAQSNKKQASQPATSAAKGKDTVTASGSTTLVRSGNAANNESQSNTSKQKPSTSSKQPHASSAHSTSLHNNAVQANKQQLKHQQQQQQSAQQIQQSALSAASHPAPALEQEKLASQLKRQQARGAGASGSKQVTSSTRPVSPTTHVKKNDQSCSQSVSGAHYRGTQSTSVSKSVNLNNSQRIRNKQQSIYSAKGAGARGSEVLYTTRPTGADKDESRDDLDEEFIMKSMSSKNSSSRISRHHKAEETLQIVKLHLLRRQFGQLKDDSGAADPAAHQSQIALALQQQVSLDSATSYAKALESQEPTTTSRFVPLLSSPSESELSGSDNDSAYNNSRSNSDARSSRPLQSTRGAELDVSKHSITNKSAVSVQKQKTQPTKTSQAKSLMPKSNPFKPSSTTSSVRQNSELVGSPQTKGKPQAGLQQSSSATKQKQNARHKDKAGSGGTPQPTAKNGTNHHNGQQLQLQQFVKKQKTNTGDDAAAVLDQIQLGFLDDETAAGSHGVFAAVSVAEEVTEGGSSAGQGFASQQVFAPTSFNFGFGLGFGSTTASEFGVSSGGQLKNNSASAFAGTTSNVSLFQSSKPWPGSAEGKGAQTASHNRLSEGQDLQRLQSVKQALSRHSGTGPLASFNWSLLPNPSSVWEQSEKEESASEGRFDSLTGLAIATGGGTSANLAIDSRWSSSDCEVPQSVKDLWASQAPASSSQLSAPVQPNPFSRSLFGQSRQSQLRDSSFYSGSGSNRTQQAPQNNSILSSFKVNKIE